MCPLIPSMNAYSNLNPPRNPWNVCNGPPHPVHLVSLLSLYNNPRSQMKFQEQEQGKCMERDLQQGHQQLKQHFQSHASQHPLSEQQPLSSTHPWHFIHYMVVSFQYCHFWYFSYHSGGGVSSGSPSGVFFVKRYFMVRLGSYGS